MQGGANHDTILLQPIQRLSEQRAGAGELLADLYGKVLMLWHPMLYDGPADVIPYSSCPAPYKYKQMCPGCVAR